MTADVCPDCGLQHPPVDPVRPPDTDREPEPDPELAAARAARGCMVALVLGTIAWIALLLLARLAFDAIATAPSAAAATPYTWRPESAEVFRPVPSSEASFAAVKPTPKLTPKPTRSPRPPTVDTGHGSYLVGGWATYWPARGGAAGAYLARAMGGGRRYLGQTVRVWLGDRHVDVVLVTSCACGDRHGEHTVIDLPYAAFAELVAPTSPPTRGVIRIRIERLP